MNGLITIAQQTPATGDSFNPAILAVIAGVAVAALILSAVLSKKENSKSEVEDEDDDEEEE